jgi:hypothetical protein
MNLSWSKLSSLRRLGVRLCGGRTSEMIKTYEYYLESLSVVGLLFHIPCVLLSKILFVELFNSVFFPSSHIFLSSRLLPSQQESRDSSVGIVTDYMLDDRGVGVRVPVWARIFTSLCRPEGHAVA